jgi:hypothetical protein
MGIFGDDSKTVWFKAFTIAGYYANLGASCPVCGGCVRYGLAPGQSTFEHCGRKEKAPTEIRDLDCKSLRRGLPDLPRGYTLVDTWENDDWERDSNAKSFNPEAMDVPWV